MPVRSSRDVRRSLRSKGFLEDVKSHHVFLWYLCDGKKTGVYTKVSHGSGGADIGSPLLGKMARQCRLSKGDFLDLVDCPLSAEDYRNRLVAGGHL